MNMIRKDALLIEEDRDRKNARGLLSILSLFTSMGTLLCCALPAAVATVAGGSAVIAMTSTMPWLIPLSRHKDWIFLAAITLLVLHGILLFWPKGTVACSIDSSEGCAVAGRYTKIMFQISAGIVAIGAFFAYALVPVLRLLESF